MVNSPGSCFSLILWDIFTFFVSSQKKKKKDVKGCYYILSSAFSFSIIFLEVDIDAFNS